MDFFFEHARFYLLDGYVSRAAQSVLIEMAFWTLLFLSYASVTSEAFRSCFKKYRFWYTAHTRGGMFALNAQDDLPILSVVGIQHVIGGVLMTTGVLRGDPKLWRHGLLCEAGYELGDIISMVLSIFPYDVNIKEEMRIPIVCHHMPGIILSFVILVSDLQTNPHLMSIGMWLLLAGGIALLVGLYVSTLDFNRDMKKAALAYTLNIVFFGYARFWAFPRESYHLINDVKENPDHSVTTLTLLYASAALYTIFNVGIMLDSIPKVIRYNKRAYDGVTAIDTMPVPPPKEGRMKRRKSSIYRVMKTMGIKTSRPSVFESLERWEEPAPNEAAMLSTTRRYSTLVLCDPMDIVRKNE